MRRCYKLRVVSVSGVRDADPGLRLLACRQLSCRQAFRLLCRQPRRSTSRRKCLAGAAPSKSDWSPADQLAELRGPEQPYRKHCSVTAALLHVLDPMHLCVTAPGASLNVVVGVHADACRYEHVFKLLATVDPYVTLWTTINEFYNSYSVWMSGPFWKLAPEQVEAETTEAFRWVCSRNGYVAIGINMSAATGHQPLQTPPGSRIVAARCAYKGRWSSSSGNACS